MKRHKALRALAAALLASAALAPFASAAPAPQEALPSVGGAAFSVGAPALSTQLPHVGPRVGFQRRGNGFRNYGKRWVPGHWTVTTQRVWQPGVSKQVWVPPVYATKYDHCGNPYQVLVTPGHHKTVVEPGCWASKRVRVWKPGCWV